jgi:large subunit ribosomal protein L29
LEVVNLFTMKIHEIREIATIEDLISKIDEEEKNLQDLKFLLATKQLENTAKIRNTRRDIARMKTILIQRKAKLDKTTQNKK